MATSTDEESAPDGATEMLDGHAIVAGFGVPGRAVADLLASRGVDYCVIEMNPETVVRLARVATPVIPGDVADESVLQQAGIARATLIAIAVPSDPAVLAAVSLARRLNPAVRIIARCRHISTAIEAARRGADEVVSEEQVVAEAFARVVRPMIG